MERNHSTLHTFNRNPTNTRQTLNKPETNTHSTQPQLNSTHGGLKKTLLFDNPVNLNESG